MLNLSLNNINYSDNRRNINSKPNIVVDDTYKHFIKYLGKYHFQVKAIIQDILDCRQSMQVLNELNEKGRNKISLLREEIENFSAYATESGDQKYLLEVVSQRQLLSGLIKEFKEANLNSMFAIENAQRQDLLKSHDENKSVVKNRKKTKADRDGLLNMSTGVTEQLLSISRQLAATTQRSQDTLDSLVSSSTVVHGTQAELQNTGSTITQSSKLLKKYGRREFTDKVIVFFAFLFFLAVCLYIVEKRLF